MEGNEKVKMPQQAENDKNENRNDTKNENDIGETSVDSVADHNLKGLCTLFRNNKAILQL